jgi:hypothetical protein
MIAAPASAASIDCRAISSGVIGKASDIVGVWIDPVTAQEMITLVRLATVIQSFRLSQRLSWSIAHGMSNSEGPSLRYSDYSEVRIRASPQTLTVSGVRPVSIPKTTYQAVENRF